MLRRKVNASMPPSLPFQLSSRRVAAVREARQRLKQALNATARQPRVQPPANVVDAFLLGVAELQRPLNWLFSRRSGRFLSAVFERRFGRLERRFLSAPITSTDRSFPSASSFSNLERALVSSSDSAILSSSLSASSPSSPSLSSLPSPDGFRLKQQLSKDPRSIADRFMLLDTEKRKMMLTGLLQCLWPRGSSDIQPLCKWIRQLYGYNDLVSLLLELASARPDCSPRFRARIFHSSVKVWLPEQGHALDLSNLSHVIRAMAGFTSHGQNAVLPDSVLHVFRALKQLQSDPSTILANFCNFTQLIYKEKTVPNAVVHQLLQAASAIDKPTPKIQELLFVLMTQTESLSTATCFLSLRNIGKNQDLLEQAFEYLLLPRNEHLLAQSCIQQHFLGAVKNSNRLYWFHRFQRHGIRLQPTSVCTLVIQLLDNHRFESQFLQLLSVMEQTSSLNFSLYLKMFSHIHHSSHERRLLHTLNEIFLESKQRLLVSRRELIDWIRCIGGHDHHLLDNIWLYLVSDEMTNNSTSTDGRYKMWTWRLIKNDTSTSTFEDHKLLCAFLYARGNHTEHLKRFLCETSSKIQSSHWSEHVVKVAFQAMWYRPNEREELMRMVYPFVMANERDFQFEDDFKEKAEWLRQVYSQMRSISRELEDNKP